MTDLEALKKLVLAPYIIKATALISVQRRVGGNQFRHCFSTLGILFDYKYYNDSILLKASLLHDLVEDLPETQVGELRRIDSEGNEVVELVLEVTSVIAQAEMETSNAVSKISLFNVFTVKAFDN